MRTRKTLVTLTLLTALFIGFAFAFPDWYYSQTRTTTVTEYLVTLDSIPSSVAKGGILDLAGTVLNGASPVVGATVHIFLDDADVGTTTTDSGGNYAYQYTVTQNAETVLNFKAGINV